MKIILFLLTTTILFAYSCKSSTTSVTEADVYETCCDSAFLALEPFTIQTKYGTINMLLPAGYKEVNPDLVIYLNDIKYMEQRAFLSSKSKFTKLLIHIDRNDSSDIPIIQLAQLSLNREIPNPNDISFQELKNNGRDTVIYTTELSRSANDSIFSILTCTFFRDSLYYGIDITDIDKYNQFSFAQKKKIIESVRITK